MIICCFSSLSQVVIPAKKSEMRSSCPMTIDVLPDSPRAGISPRISFSYDLSQSDVVPVEEHKCATSSTTIDFDFCVFRGSFDQESSTADELFLDGKILPIEIKKRLAAPPRRVEEPPPVPPRSQPATPPRTTRNSGAIINETKNKNPNPNFSEDKQKPFWRFKRSSSLNCGSGYARTLCPLPLLSRSNSTGSSANVKRSSLTYNQKLGFLRRPTSNGSQKQPQSAACSSRPPLNRSNCASYGGRVKFNPVLHVPSADLFGLCSIFSMGKDRRKKKY